MLPYICIAGEENVTMLDDRHYGQENILIHEFAHSVMCIGMDDEQRQNVCFAYDEAVRSGSYQRHIYMMENADEYWAEATQAWFDATVRTGYASLSLHRMTTLIDNLGTCRPSTC